MLTSTLLSLHDIKVIDIKVLGGAYLTLITWSSPTWWLWLHLL